MSSYDVLLVSLNVLDHLTRLLLTLYPPSKKTDGVSNSPSLHSLSPDRFTPTSRLHFLIPFLRFYFLFLNVGSSLAGRGEW